MRVDHVEPAGLPFRLEDDTPLVHGAWTADLEPGEPPRFRHGAEERSLLQERVTLRYWDCEKKELVDDPRGPLTLRWVRDEASGDMPVVEPSPAP